MKNIQPKRKIGTLILVLISLGISLTLAEVALRFIYPIGVGSPLRHRIPNPVYGWSLEPGVSFLNQMSEATVSVTYNSKGWRDENHSLEKPRDTVRIVVLGDSFMEAYSVNFKDSIHKQLEVLARENGVNLEVINLGVGGYGTLQEYLVFLNVGRDYKPDIVLLGFFLSNDVANNSMVLETMIRKDATKAISRPYLNPSADTWQITQIDYEGARRRFLAALAKREAAFHRKPGKLALIQAMEYSITRLEKLLTEKKGKTQTAEYQYEENKDLRSFVWHGVNYCQEPKEYTEAWGITKRILARLNYEVENIGAKLVVFSVPGLYEVVPEKIKDISSRKVPHPELICGEEAPAYTRLQGILHDLGIEYINLLPDFRKNMRDEGIDLFRYSDEHWNEQGHHLAAKIVYDSLSSKDKMIDNRSFRP